MRFAPTRKTSNVPSIAIGTIGSCDLIASRNAPRWNGRISRFRDRPSSGKITIVFPLRIRSAARSNDFTAVRRFLRSIGMKPARPSDQPKIGILKRLDLRHEADRLRHRGEDAGDVEVAVVIRDQDVALLADRASPSSRRADRCPAAREERARPETDEPVDQRVPTMRRQDATTNTADEASGIVDEHGGYGTAQMRSEHRRGMTTLARLRTRY